MTFQDLGSIGELIAAFATLITLGYLALQLKQNTTALKSQTFQQSSMDMSLTANSISSDGDLARIIIKAENGLSALHQMRDFVFTSGCLLQLGDLRRYIFRHCTVRLKEKELRDSKDLLCLYYQMLVQNGGKQPNLLLVVSLLPMRIKIFHQVISVQLYIQEKIVKINF